MTNVGHGDPNCPYCNGRGVVLKPHSSRCETDPCKCVTYYKVSERDEVIEAAKALLEDYDGVEDLLPLETATKVYRLREVLSSLGKKD